MNQAVPELKEHETQASDDIFRVSLMEEPLRCEHSGMPVLQLLAALRRYHQERDLSHQERFGTPDPQARQALSELGQAQESLRQLTSGAGDEHDSIVIEACLNLKMAPRRS
jgi:hypothetical protein